MNHHLPITSAAKRAGQIITGQYRVVSRQLSALLNGEQALRLDLADASGAMMAFMSPFRSASGNGIRDLDVVEVSGRMDRIGTRCLMYVQQLRIVPPGQTHHGAWMLPWNLCPPEARHALAELVALEDSTFAPLGEFLKRVLADPQIGIPLLRCRASQNHHHAYPGGLLVHSTNMINLAAESARVTLPQDPLAPDVARIAYLLHDIGKIRTVGENQRPVNADVVRHGTQNLLVLAGHLEWLGRQSPELAAALQYIFEYLATPSAQREQAKYLVAEIVVSLDQWSASSYMRRDMGGLLGQPNVDDLIEAFKSVSLNHGGKARGQSHAS